mmetsp:Transcript_31787/g.38413  ORF Transcript_31787/g.38413 Transcript_31787/m.38413 type:complete len:185 (-) Transcript_31787:406-960(-)|eukprot:CAMPEP_0197854248 /NCGR_PEP_ID=MMETSP1438-20131217/24316_1 /TAXON_ID=1461541 /ORGANISM="Pterosperma sp., Strain CCMP1384" /LENGTH=184 /DNA_ID=CAMNT_0043468919 /DNA_START=125 /DNA_END=679 /DNA_ORIENTATION=-
MAENQSQDIEDQVPKAEFIEDIDEYMKGKVTEEVLKNLQERYQQYKLAESRIQQVRLKMQTKMPDIKKGIEMVDLLLSKSDSGEEVQIQYELTDNIYARAKVEGAKTVNLWLGANVMLEYPLDEAKALLEQNYNNAKTALENSIKDMYYLRDQITTTEVSIARTYNFDVKRRREQGTSSEKMEE